MYISPVSLSSTSCSFWVQGLALVSSPTLQSVDLVMMFTVVDFPVLVDPTIITQAFGLIFGFSFSSLMSPIFWLESVPCPSFSEVLRRLKTCTTPALKHVSAKTLDFSPYVSDGKAWVVLTQLNTAGCSVYCFPAGNPTYLRH